MLGQQPLSWCADNGDMVLSGPDFGNVEFSRLTGPSEIPFPKDWNEHAPSEWRTP